MLHCSLIVVTSLNSYTESIKRPYFILKWLGGNSEPVWAAITLPIAVLIGCVTYEVCGVGSITLTLAHLLVKKKCFFRILLGERRNGSKSFKDKVFGSVMFSFSFLLYCFDF